MLFSRYVNTNRWTEAQEKGYWQTMIANQGIDQPTAKYLVDCAYKENDGCVESFLCENLVRGNYQQGFRDISHSVWDSNPDLNEELVFGDGRPVKKGWFSW